MKFDPLSCQLPVAMAGEIERKMSVNLEKLRTKVREYVERHQYETALFWADKIVALSAGEPQDLYWYSQCLYMTSQYHRAAHLLKLNQLDKKYLACRYLAAKCHYESREYQEALDILDQAEVITGLSCRASLTSDFLPNTIPSERMESSVCLLRGKVYEAMGNRGLAAECFRQALQHDIWCFEAYHNLVHHHMLSAQEERELLDSLQFSSQCSNDEIELVKFLYEIRLKKYDKPSDLMVPGNLEKLSENLDVAVALAERHYYNCDFTQSFKLTTAVLNKDPYNEHCLPLHIAILVELRKSNVLFYLAHKLVDLYPTKAVAWFAVGCYYLLVGKNDPARRFLSKATTLDRVYGPAWLAFGHSFAVENEHDQAMAAYFTAAQLMKGCHLPVLYIGLEYGLTNNTKLALRFFSQALAIAPEDPFVLHEMGVTAFQNKDWEQADEHFKKALDMVKGINEEVLAEKWEPLLNNLGHTCRKLKKYDDALEFHRQALVLSPLNPSTLSAMGYVNVLMGNPSAAVDYFHQALGLRRDDTFSTTMLGHAIEELLSEMPPCEGVPDELPIYTYDGKLDISQSSTSELEPAQLSLSQLDSMTDSVASEKDISLADSSNMAIDTDMEEG